MVSTDCFYQHQKEYYDSLMQQQGPFHSLLCIPTGGGKTRLAATYAINKALKEGKKVLWVTHSQYLLNQAYEAFENLIKDSKWMKDYSILVHSKAKNSADIGDTHQLIIISFQSLIRCTKDWQSIIGEDVSIIIDEAHHVVAESYMKLIADYSIGKTTLGLSATPIRVKNRENNDLYKFFETDLGVRIHITSLFKDKILVKPLFEEVNFSLDNSVIHSLDGLCNNLSAQAENYNSLIFNKYKDNEDKYGKTVIFALNKDHVDSLYDLFYTQGYENKVYRVYSGLNTREEQFKAFSKSKNGILINVNIMNEGVDIPDIQSIFLTKPLNSRIAVTQIVGRALRKPKDSHKECAYVVNFAVSNIGRKILLVTPKLSYKLYTAEWSKDPKLLEIAELEEENISSIAELVSDAIKQKATCSFSNIFLAGHFTLIKDENTDIPLPVSFKEYRVITAYILGKKTQKKLKFPKKLFFCEAVEEMKYLIDQSLSQSVEIIFTKYDEDVFSCMDKITGDIQDLYMEAKESEYTRSKIDGKINAIFLQLSPDIIYYLNQIGANNKRTFNLLVKNEFTIIKYRGADENDRK